MATPEQLAEALRRADASGNAEDARRIAFAIAAQRKASASPASKPWQDNGTAIGRVLEAGTNAAGKAWGDKPLGYTSPESEEKARNIGIALDPDKPLWQQPGTALIDPLVRTGRVVGDLGARAIGSVVEGVGEAGGQLLNETGISEVLQSQIPGSPYSPEYYAQHKDRMDDRTRKSVAEFAKVAPVAFAEVPRMASRAVTKQVRSVQPPKPKVAKAPTIRQQKAARTVGLVDDFEKSGIDPTGAAAAITDSKFLGTLKAGLDNYLTSAGTMGNAARKTLSDFNAAAGKLADEYGAATTQEAAGQALKRGTGSFLERFAKTSDRLYGALDKHIKPQDGVGLPETASLIEGQLGQYARTPTIQSMAVPPKLKGILDDIKTNDGTLSWKEVKDLRSLVGKKIGDMRDDSGIPEGMWKQLYGALSKDLEAAANAKGPGAAKAFSRANTYYRAGRNRIDNFIKPIADSATAEQAMNLAIRGDKKGGTVLRTLRRSLPAEDWGDFASYQLRKLGAAKPGAQDAEGSLFSPATFLTNWNSMAPGAKDALFGGTQYAPLRTQLDRLARMTGAMKEVEKSANTSRTAGTLATLATLAPSYMLSDPVMAGLTLAAPYGAARLMTSAPFIRYLTWRANRLASKAKITPEMETAQLRSVAKQDAAIADELADYMRGVLPAVSGRTNASGDLGGASGTAAPGVPGGPRKKSAGGRALSGLERNSGHAGRSP